MNIPVRVEPGAESPAPVDYRWDEDTDILSAKIAKAPLGTWKLTPR